METLKIIYEYTTEANAKLKSCIELNEPIYKDDVFDLFNIAFESIFESSLINYIKKIHD